MSDRRVARMTAISLGFLLLATACSTGKGGGASLAGSVDPSPPASEPAPVTTPTTALTTDSLVLSADGLGPLRFGTQAAVALAGLTRAFGTTARATPVADRQACGATRIFRWDNLAVFVNEVTDRSAAGFVGWSLSGTTSGPDLKTGQGIGIGSTLRRIRAAYGDKAVATTGGHPPALRITTADGALTATLDGAVDTATVRTLEAGVVCGT